MNKVQECVTLLKELSKLEKDKYKSIAYSRASEEISKLAEDVFNSKVNFTDLPFIGNGINNKIIEFKNTGTIDKLEDLRKRSIKEDLYKVRSSGFTSKRISIELADSYVEGFMALFDYPLKFWTAGSLRRRKELIGDIDILVDESDYEHVCKVMDKNFKKLSKGDYKASYLINEEDGTQMDIISTTEKDRAYQLLYLTGSKEFNIKMRSKAKYLGYTLNQKGLYDHYGNLIVHDRIPTESDIFRFLGMEYIKPEDRN